MMGTCWLDLSLHYTATTSDPLKSHWGLQKISKTFFMAEAVTVANAVAMLKKPR